MLFLMGLRCLRLDSLKFVNRMLSGSIPLASSTSSADDSTFLRLTALLLSPLTLASLNDFMVFRCISGRSSTQSSCRAAPVSWRLYRTSSRVWGVEHPNTAVNPCIRVCCSEKEGIAVPWRSSVCLRQSGLRFGQNFTQRHRSCGKEAVALVGKVSADPDGERKEGQQDIKG